MKNLINSNSKHRPLNRLPVWFKQEIPQTIVLERARILSESNIHTVCQEAKCPNLNFCFKNLKFTFMILGDRCSRDCRFCAVGKYNRKKKLILDEDEPQRIARIVERLGLKFVVITSVTRDDLEEGGAEIFAKTIKVIHDIDKDIKVEVLIPDFKGRVSSFKIILDAQPQVIAHNIETVRRLYPDIKPLANYALSLNVLRRIKELNPDVITKSSIMLGLGETEREVIETMEDLRGTQCNILTLGQYLAPSNQHYPVKDFIGIEQFQRYQELGLSLGFKSVLSGPLVRSSYQAEEIYQEALYV